MATNPSRKPHSGETAKPPVFKLRDGVLNLAGWERIVVNSRVLSLNGGRSLPR